METQEHYLKVFIAARALGLISRLDCNRCKGWFGGAPPRWGDPVGDFRVTMYGKSIYRWLRKEHWAEIVALLARDRLSGVERW